QELQGLRFPGANQSDDGHPDMDADTDAQRGPQLICQIRAENLQPIPDLECCPKRVARRRRNRPVHAEDAHYAIAVNAGGVTSIAPNRLCDRLNVSVEDE